MAHEGTPPRRAGISGADAPAWNRWVDAWLTPLSIEAEGPAPLRVSASGAAHGALRFAVIDSGAHTAVRTERLVTEGDPTFWLALQITGTSSIEQAGRRSDLGPGDVVAYDSTMPYRRSFPGDARTMVVLIPQRLLSLPPRALAEVAALRLGGGQDATGAVLSAFLTAIAENLDRLGPTDGARLAHTLVDLVDGIVASRLGVAGEEPRRRAEVAGIRAWIMERLGDPDLTPRVIAAAHYVSVRRLHVLFHEEGTTVGTWIRERRLDMARRELETTAEPVIGEVAARWGFRDPAYFARVFRAAYGLAPGAYHRSVSRVTPAAGPAAG